LPEISRAVRRVRRSSAAQHLDSKEARFYFRKNRIEIKGAKNRSQDLPSGFLPSAGSVHPFSWDFEESGTEAADSTGKDAAFGSSLAGDRAVRPSNVSEADRLVP
jgi:hypothetical protein